MRDQEIRNAADSMIYLISCALNDFVPDAARVKTMRLEQVYQLAEIHRLSSIVAMALESIGIHDPAFTQAKAKAIRKAVLMDAEMTSLCEKLEGAGIWHLPLKGAVLKDCYPSLGMRQMADYDILIDPSRADDVMEIMEGLGFTTERFDMSNHDVYHKEPVCNFEIHRALFGPTHDEKVREYYENVKDRLLGSGHKKHLSPEDLYIYFIAHQYKHYSVSGTGLRFLVDTYVYLKKITLDMEYVTAELQKINLLSFETAIHSLSFHLFQGDPITLEEKEILDYILSSGAYGTINHRIRNTMKKNGWSRFQYIWNRFLIPFSTKQNNYQEYAAIYPFFYRHKVLLSFLPFYRVFHAWIGGRLLREVKAVIKK